MTTMCKGILTAAVIAGGIGLASQSHAELIAYDGFDYTAPGDNLIGGNTGTGWAEPWTQTGTTNHPLMVSGSLEYTDGNGDELDTTGNHFFSSTGGRQARRDLLNEFIPVAGDDVWVSFRIQDTDTGNLPSNHAGIGLYTSDDAGGEELFLGHPGFSGTNWGFNYLGTSGGAVRASGNADTLGLKDVFLLYHIEYGATNQTISMWINPDLADEGNLGTPDATSSAETGLDPIRSVRFSTNTSSDDIHFDEFRLGTEFSDVTVPEPASLSLLAIGGLAVLRRRRMTK